MQIKLVAGIGADRMPVAYLSFSDGMTIEATTASPVDVTREVAAAVVSSPGMAEALREAAANEAGG